MFPFKNNNSKPLLRNSRSDSGINYACVKGKSLYLQQYLHIYAFRLYNFARARGVRRANLDLLVWILAELNRELC